MKLNHQVLLNDRPVYISDFNLWIQKMSDIFLCTYAHLQQEQEYKTLDYGVLSHYPNTIAAAFICWYVIHNMAQYIWYTKYITLDVMSDTMERPIPSQA